MTAQELRNYINIRNGELSSDEILYVIDISRNPEINHVKYHDGKWEMWSEFGDYYTFRKRNW